MSIKHLLTGLLLCLPYYILAATDGRIHGAIKDESGTPLEYANVTLLKAADSTLIAGAVTDALGLFYLPGFNHASVMRVSALGYMDKFIENPSGDMGDIFLQPSVTELEEVVVHGHRPIAKIKDDGIQVAISGTYLATSGTALDVLGKMPFVTRCGSELEVIGKGSPLIYLNGRQVLDISEIEQLQSTQIKDVEIVTNPGARYPSTANSVIRISTVAPVGEGFSANNKTTVGYKHYAYIFEQLNLNYRVSGLDVFGMLNYENYRERTAFDNRTTQFLNAGTVVSDNQGSEFSKYPVYQGKIGFNYNHAANNFGMYYDFGYRPAHTNSQSESGRFVNSVLSDNLTQSYAGQKQNRQHLLSAYYTGTAGKWNISANFDAIWQINERTTDEQETSTSTSQRAYSTRNNVTNRLIAGNINASLPIWKGNIRFGVEVSNIYRTDRYSSEADFIADNDTKINETTYSLFAESSQKFGIVEVSAGVRWEYTSAKSYLFGKKQGDQSRDYNNLAPSASVAIPIGNVNARLNYSRKTARPAFEQLSSAVRYIDRYNYESGNPNLRPIYRDYVSLSASWKDFVLEMDLTSTDNYFMWQTTPYLGSTDITLITMQNMPRFNSFSAMASYSPAIGCWRPDFMAAVQCHDFRLIHRGHEMKLNRPLGIFRFNNAIHLPWHIWLNVDFSARTSGDGDNFHLKSSWNCDLGLYKSFADDTWNIKLQINDIFGTWRQELVAYNGLSTMSVHKIRDTRDLALTIRYNFNTAHSRYRGRGVANSQKSRL